MLSKEHPIFFAVSKLTATEYMFSKCWLRERGTAPANAWEILVAIQMPDRVRPLDDRLNKMNGFPKRNGFQTFLLDKDNRVVAILTR